MNGLKNFIDTVRSIKRAYHIIVKVIGYVDKALVLYPIAENVLLKLGLIEDKKKMPEQ